ncbi:NAD-dependent deacetylase sir2A-like [Argopecten irradians]|uniref:NAD-dependent deacetylase sir2A-like n=1 Tax=Argopecten irradians TaxID=31199 RepID=UPI003724BC29
MALVVKMLIFGLCFTFVHSVSLLRNCKMVGNVCTLKSQQDMNAHFELLPPSSQTASSQTTSPSSQTTSSSTITTSATIATSSSTIATSSEQTTSSSNTTLTNAASSEFIDSSTATSEFADSSTASLNTTADTPLPTSVLPFWI